MKRKPFGRVSFLNTQAARNVHPDHPVLQEISEREKQRKQNQININKGLTLFEMKDGSRIWALNEKSANRKFLKQQHND